MKRPHTLPPFPAGQITRFLLAIPREDRPTILALIRSASSRWETTWTVAAAILARGGRLPLAFVFEETIPAPYDLDSILDHVPRSTWERVPQDLGGSAVGHE